VFALKFSVAQKIDVINTAYDLKSSKKYKNDRKRSTYLDHGINDDFFVIKVLDKIFSGVISLASGYPCTIAVYFHNFRNVS